MTDRFSDIGKRVQLEMTTIFGCGTLLYGRIVDTTRSDYYILTESHPERLVILPKDSPRLSLDHNPEPWAPE